RSQHRDLLNLAGCFEVERLEPCLARRKRSPAAHGWVTGHEKNDVLRHETQHFLRVSGFGGAQPRGNQLPNRLLIVLHKASGRIKPVNRAFLSTLLVALASSYSLTVVVAILLSASSL